MTCPACSAPEDPCSCVACPECSALAPVADVSTSETLANVCGCGWRDDRCDCGQLFRFDAALRGRTMGGLDLVGWGVCDCGATRLTRRAKTADAVDWRLSGGGRSLVAGGIKLRAEKTEHDVGALMARIVVVPALEREVEMLREMLKRTERVP